MVSSVQLLCCTVFFLLFHYATIKCTVDTVNYILHEGSPDTLFGYNVFLHEENEQNWVVVGAPQAITTSQSNVSITGGMYKCNVANKESCQDVPFDENVQSYSQMLTKYRSASIPDSYRNYSVAVGNFEGPGKLINYAIGMPDERGRLGMVQFFSTNMTNHRNITGEQVGANFGYSLCAVDVDGDNLDDLIVGAPLYTKRNGKGEVGRIYVIYQSKNVKHKFQEIETIDGVKASARFGWSLTTLNDINLDGFGDFAVGAPYDGPNGRGAVYIYHGSPTGPLAKHSQIIYAEDITENVLTPFGYSISGGIDLDGNMYPDIAVGAYNSNTVVVFKSHPVVHVEASTAFFSEPKFVLLDDKKCSLQDSSKVACTNIITCMKYSGINVDSFLDFNVSLTLDAKHNRLFFLPTEGVNTFNQTIRLYRRRQECMRRQVYISGSIRNKLTPLQVEMNFNLLNSLTSSKGKPQLDPPVTLDQSSETRRTDTIHIQHNCGMDNVCIPDLRLNVRSVDKFTFASNADAYARLKFDVMVTNYGEDAFETTFFMIFPNGWEYVKVESTDNNFFAVCALRSSPQNTLVCDIGNPLSAGKMITFSVVTVPRYRVTDATSEFYMEVNSTNTEFRSYYSDDNVIKKTIAIESATTSGEAQIQ